jgi:magnesium transporter
MITVHYATAGDDHFEQIPVSAGGAIPPGAIWLDLLHPTTDEELAVETYLGIDVPTRAEMLTIEPSNLLYVEEGASFMSARVLSHSDEDVPRLVPVSFILKGGKLATVRYDEPRSFDLFVSRLARPGACGTTGEQVFGALMETVIDRASEILSGLGERIDVITEDIFRANTQLSRRGPRDYRHVLTTLGREGDRISKVRESLVSIERMLLFFSTRVETVKQLGSLKNELKTTLRDMQSLEDHATFLNDKIQFLLDAVLGLVSLDQNNIVKIFSVAAVVFMPPTLIASIYGMNFDVMPELKFTYGFPMAIGMMALSAVFTYLFFRWKRWL